MAKTTKTSTTTSKKKSTPPAVTTKAASVAPVAAKTAPAATKATTTPPATVSSKATTVVPTPASTKSVPPTAATTTTARNAAPVTTTVGSTANGPVSVLVEKTPVTIKARIRYAGALAQQDRVVARLGCEWFGTPRWLDQREVELTRGRDGSHEGIVELKKTDVRGKDLMALQLAFASADRKRWDTGGVPYGYYQVSTLTGSVENVPSSH